MKKLQAGVPQRYGEDMFALKEVSGNEDTERKKKRWR